MKALIGIEQVCPPELIEKKAIRDFAIAIAWPDPPDPLYVDEEFAKKTRYGGIIAPWSFFTSLGRVLPPQELPLPPPRVSVNGGRDYEYFQHIRPGDLITTTNKVVDIYERRGRGGRLLFTVVQRTFTNQRNEVVGIVRRTSISQY